MPMSCPVNLSSNAGYFYTPNPNVPPPTRSFLPSSSSQPSASTSGSSPFKPSCFSSAQARRLSLLEGDDVFSPEEQGRNRALFQIQAGAGPGYVQAEAHEEKEDEDEDEEFRGMAYISDTQWIREVSSARASSSGRSARSKTRSERASSGLALDSELAMDDEDDYNYDYGNDKNIDGQGERKGTATLSQLFPSQREYARLSPDLQTPTASHSLSDPTTVGAPITPYTPRHRESTISWSPSPLSSRSRSKHTKSERQLVIIDASDEDTEDKENNPPFPTRVGSPTFPVRSRVMSKGKGRRINDTDDDDEEDEEDVPLAKRARARANEMGKGKEREREVDIPIPVQTLDVDLDESTFDDMDYSPPPEAEAETEAGVVEARAARDVPTARGESQYDTFDDIAFADFDLNLDLPNPVPVTSSRRTTTLSTVPLAQPYTSTPRQAQTAQPTTYGTSILDIIDDAIPSFKMVQDLEEPFREFYENHWRRGARADKQKKRTGAGAGLVEEIDEEEEERMREKEREREAKKKERVKAAFRGRFGGGWRGRGGARGVRGGKRKR